MHQDNIDFQSVTAFPEFNETLAVWIGYSPLSPLGTYMYGC